MRRRLWPLCALLAACGSDAEPSLPAVRFGMYVLTRVTAPDGTIWVGTFDHGLWRLARGATAWDSVPTDDPVHALAFQGDTVWIGTIGNGWARSVDDGHSWERWTLARATTPQGLARRGDTVWVATLEGVFMTADHGTAWRRLDGLRHSYILAFAAAGSRLYVSHGRGVEVSHDGGRSWTFVAPPNDDLHRTRQFAAPGDDPERLVRFVASPATPGRDRLAWPRPARADSAAGPLHAWFVRPVADTDQPYLDQTWRFGARTDTGQPLHRGVDFPNAPGTPVMALGDGVVGWIGETPVGPTVVMRHDRHLVVDDAAYAVFSLYGSLGSVDTERGRRLAAGERVGRTGVAEAGRSPRLHVEVHAVPLALADSLGLIVGPRAGGYATNPELWLTPTRHAGMVAGTVRLGEARVRGIRIYGLAKPLPHEFPLAFIETYHDGAASSPAYDEDFAVTDVPPGDYLIGLDLDGRRQFRTLNVQPGAVTWVTFGR